MEKVTISLPFIKGNDDKLNEKLSDSPVDIKNCYISEDGTLKKVNGCEVLPKDILNGGTIDKCIFADSLGSDIIAHDGSNFYSYVNSLGKWKQKQGITLSSNKVSEIKKTSTATTTTGYIENDNFYIVLENMAVTFEATSYSKLDDTEIDSSPTGIRGLFFEYQNEIGIVYLKDVGGGATSNLAMVKLLPNGTFDTEIIISTGHLGNSLSEISLDCSYNGSNLYVSLFTIGQHTVMQIDLSGNILNRYDVAQTAYTNGFYTSSVVEADDGTVDYYFTSFTDSSGQGTLNYRNLSSDLQTVNKTETLGTYTDYFSYSCINYGGYTWLFIQVGKTNGSGFEIKAILSNGGLSHFNTTNFDSNLREIKLYSGAFIFNGRPCVLVLNQSQNIPTSFGSLYIMDNSGRNQGYLSNLIAPTGGSSFYQLQRYTEKNNIVKIPFSTGSERGRFVSLYTFTVNSLNSKSVEYQNVKFINGSLPVVYDGTDFFEPSFNSIPLVSISLAGGGPLTGTYYYRVVFKYVDNKGNIYRSGTSREVSAVGSSNSIALSISGNLDRDQYTAEIYRSKDTEDAFKFVAETSIIGLNDVSYTDSKSDSIIQENPLIYSQAELDNFTFAGGNALTWNNGRLFNLTNEKNEVTYSKKYTQGDGIAFPAEYLFFVEDAQNKRLDSVTSLASMDSKTIVFKENSTLMIYGNGPENDGQADDFTAPEIISSDVGCISDKSIVLTGAGVIFQSKKGIYLLGRNLVLSYIGAGIENALNGTVIDSELMSSEHQVRMTLDSGRVVFYNTFYDKWTWSDIYTGLIDSFTVDGKFGYADSLGNVYIENKSIYRNNGEFIQQVYDTGWLKLKGVQDFQRISKVQFEGDYLDNHRIEVLAYYDYNINDFDRYEIELDNLSRFQFSIHLKRQKCQAIKFVIKCLDTGDTQEGFRLQDVSILAGIRKGLNKISSNRNF